MVDYLPNYNMILSSCLNAVIGAVMEIFKDENDVLLSIYFQTQAMQHTYSKFPVLLLIDATYKLDNL